VAVILNTFAEKWHFPEKDGTYTFQKEALLW
jgi:hypothetical protein